MRPLPSALALRVEGVGVRVSGGGPRLSAWLRDELGWEAGTLRGGDLAPPLAPRRLLRPVEHRGDAAGAPVSEPNRRLLVSAASERR